MHSATFTYAKGEHDDEFQRRDQAIALLARSKELECSASYRSASLASHQLAL